MIFAFALLFYEDVQEFVTYMVVVVCVVIDLIAFLIDYFFDGCTDHIFD